MSPSLVERLDTDLDHLSLEEQLWLMERLAYRIRMRATPSIPILVDDLRAMAADPALQHELQQIDAEFRGTDSDGWELLA